MPLWLAVALSALLAALAWGWPAELCADNSADDRTAMGRNGFIVILVLLVWALWLATGARAHENWISREGLRDPVTKEKCCNEHDCAELPAGAVVKVDGGYHIVATGEVIAAERVQFRAESGWWRCVRYTGATRCLIGPAPGA